MSEIKFKVRYSALLLKDFTVSEIIRVTGLNPESVRTELQRMRQDGLLISTPHPEMQKKRGGRPSLYRLPDDPEKLLELSKSVEAFYPPLSSTDLPSSRYYKSAKELIDQALVSEDSSNSELLSDAESDLDMAEQAEGGVLASRLIKAYLEFERARILYLNGKHEQALVAFNDLHKFFENNQIESMVKRINDYILCLKASRNFASGKPGRYGKVEWARCVLDTLNESGFQTESPLMLLLLDLLRKLSVTGDKELIANIAHEVVQAHSLIAERTEMIRNENLFQVIRKFQAIGSMYDQDLSIKNDEKPIPVGNWPQPYRDEGR